MQDFLEEVLFSNSEIVSRCSEIGKELSAKFRDKCPLFVGMLKGAIPFFAELVKHIDCDMEMDYLGLSSYEGTESTGNVIVYKDLAGDLTGRHIVIVEDIVDTGLTLQATINLLKNRGAASVTIVCLLDKKARREIEGINIDYCCFECPNKFVVGFGLDFNGLYRNLDCIGVLKKCMYE